MVLVFAQQQKPIEGELLVVTWGLQRTSYYTLGSDKLLLLVEHKPLIGLLMTRELGNVDNPRLQHLAEKLLRWTFSIQHIAGAKNKGPDALSRFPTSKDTSGSLNHSMSLMLLSKTGLTILRQMSVLLLPTEESWLHHG